MGGYPPGVSANSPRAPWNEEPAPECDCCGAIIHTEEDHESSCERSDQSANDIRRAREEAAQRTWDDVKEDPTPSEAERYGLEDRL